MDPTPFVGHRHVVASVEVVVTPDMIVSLSGGAEQTFDLGLVRDPSKPGVRPAGKVCVTHPDIAVGKGVSDVVVAVQGMPDNADAWVRGKFRSTLKSFSETTLRIFGTSLYKKYETDEHTTWTHGNGRLARFSYDLTHEVRGVVTVFGPGTAAPGPSGVPDFRPLRQLALRHATLSDVVLRAAGQDFPAHKVVLASRSAVFHAMFTETSFREASEKQVDVAVDCSVEVFGTFVEFLYAGVLGERGPADLLQLLELADRYMVLDLVQECVRQLSGVGSDAALAVFQAALERPFVPAEVRTAMAGVLHRHWQDVSASEDWLKFCAAHPTAGQTLEAFVHAVKPS